MDTISRAKIEQGDICFLLEVTYYGAIYRFSTIPIDIEDPVEGITIPYRGSLSDPPINLQSDLLGVDLEANTISIELIFEGVDWVAEFLKGKTLNDALCVLSMVIIKDGVSTLNTTDQIGIFSGRVLGAIFGDPNAPQGAISFTIENSVKIREVKLLGEQHIIIEDNYIIPLLEKSKGKVVPFVFGLPGISARESDGSIVFDTDMRVSPCYEAGGTATGKTMYYQVAYHQVDPGGFIRIHDGVGGYFANPVEFAIDKKGFIHSYVPFYITGIGSPEGTNLEYSGFQASSPEIAFTYFATWGESGGGLVNFSGDGPMEGAVDLSLYALAKSELLYDYSAWKGLEPVLNRYKFGGYVNDPEVSALEWLKNNIWAFLPIMVTTGGKGIKPALNLYTYSQEIIASHNILSSGEFEIITPFTPLESEIINKITLRFCFNGQTGSYLSTIVIDPTLEQDEPMKYRDPLAFISYTRYGLRETVLEVPFVYDLTTAVRIARDKIRSQALVNYAIEISAAPKYGYLDLGEIISLTSEKVGLTEHKCQIISKSWSENRWRYVLHIEDNPLVSIRA